MIISRTPLRISFLGGGTDYPQWFNEHDGAVLGTSIDKYCYVMLHDGHSWHTFDLPNKSGLGSSSAYTVGLLRVCTELDKVTIAKLATTWEFDKMGGNVGYQDQYLCSVGGFHHLRFSAHGIRDKVIPELVSDLADWLMLFDTHQYRRAGDVVAHQLAEMDKHEDLLTRMSEQVEDGITALATGDYPAFGELLDEAWSLKKQLSPYVSTTEVDAIYQAAINAGAIGGKLLGAGGGGFIVFCVKPDNQKAVRSALSDLNHVPFRFENEGTKVLYRD
jgi:D-glycero-alpha-D-manno-heptose-7-phosphate kinase